MATTSPASRRLSKLAISPPQCLLRSPKTSYTTSVRHFSIPAQRSRTEVISHSRSPQLVFPIRRLPTQTSFGRWGLFAQARRLFSASTVLLHDDLIPPKPGEESVVKPDYYTLYSQFTGFISLSLIRMVRSTPLRLQRATIS